MDPVAQLVRRVHPLRQATRPPVHADHEHLVTHAQLPGDDVDNRDVAAVRVEQHHLAHPGAGDRGADLAPRRDHRLGAQSQRSGIAQVLVALADGLGREEDGGAVLGQRSGRLARERIDHAGIDRQRQVRAMLLHRAEGKHRNQPFVRQARELLARMVDPETLHPRILGMPPRRGSVRAEVRRRIRGIVCVSAFRSRLAASFRPAIPDRIRA